jgi:hypothetical protein
MPNRTRAQSITRIRALIHDVQEDNFTAAEVQAAIDDGLRLLSADLLKHEYARNWLLWGTAPKAIRAAVDQYPIPADWLRVDRVEVRRTQTLSATLTCETAGETGYANWAAVTDASLSLYLDGITYDLTGVTFAGAGSMAAVAAVLQTAIRAATGGTETCTWDTDHFVLACHFEIQPIGTVAPASGTDISVAAWMNAQEATPSRTGDSQDFHALEKAAPPRGAIYGSTMTASFGTYSGRTQAWWDGQRPGYLKVWPAPQTNGQETYRIWYYRRIPALASDSHYLTIFDGADQVVEYAACAFLKGEEVEDRTQLGYFSGMYDQLLQTRLASNAQGQTMPTRRYINRIVK